MSEQNKIEQIKEEMIHVTEGPWVCDGLGVILRESDGEMIADVFDKEDAEFLAKSPEYITYLLQHVDELNGALDEPKKNLLFQMHNERIKKYEVIRERNELLRKIKLKDEALRFYADEDNYSASRPGRMDIDLGQRAREAL